ncbi:hypothetical protein [Flavobacterium oreochromis]|uniref:hypothetical protein n=1 Tax=Flavobacterium oreochromis TaxID=2906078 RepID=UPI00385979BB
MTKTELKEAKERYFERSKFIRELTASTLVAETTEEQEKRIQKLLKPENYSDFFDYYFGIGSSMAVADCKCSKYHIELYQELYKNRVITQFRWVYRGFGKSVHANIANPLALKQNNELFFMLLIGANENKAKLLLADLQLQLESNERIIKDFGQQVQYGDWAGGEFETTDKRFFLAHGVDQPIRGLRRGANRLDYVSVDDIEDRKIAENQRIVQQRVEKLTGDMTGAFGKDIRRAVASNNLITKVGVMQKWADKMQDSPYTKIHTINLTDAKGNPTWPERMSLKDVEVIHQSFDHYSLQREFYNNPIEEGKLFKEDWIKTTRVINPIWNGLLVHWDLSYTKEGDYKAGVLLGVQGNKLTVLEVFCKKCDLMDAVQTHFYWMRKYQDLGLMPLAFYDATASQEAVFLPIFNAEAERQRYFNLPLPNRQTGLDKHLRIEATLTSVLFNGLLQFDETLKNQSDYKTAIDQLLSFEKGTKAHDDFPDTLENAVRLAQKYYGYSENNSASSLKPLIGKRKTTRRV